MANPPDPSPAGERAARIGVDLRRLPWVRPLAADYAFDFRAVEPFFSGDPSQAAAWRQAIARAQARKRQPEQIATVIAAQQRRRNAPARAVENGRRLAEPGTVAVITGQQAGLFGGPLYTLLKALTAVKLAEQVSRDHQVTAVPVFWVEAEDHDWDEVRGCTVFDEGLTPRSVALPARPASDSSPVAAVRLDDSVRVAIDELERLLPATEFRAGILQGLRETYAPGTGMADAFACWIERILGDQGLIVYDASDLASKPLAAAVFAQELSAPGATSNLAGAAGARLEACGYHAQVHAAADGMALFSLEGGRQLIRRQDGAFLIGDTSCAPAALVRQATENPAAFSPAVLLRPVVQDTLFPSICYVGGPSELAYLGQLREVYDRFDVPMPLIYPRTTATLVDSAALRFLQKYDVSLESLQPQDEAGLNALLKAQIPPIVEESVAQASAAIEAAMARVAAAVPALDPTLEGAAKSTLGRMQHDLETLRGKIIQAAKRRDDTLKRQYTRTRALAFPGGHPQERTIGLVSFLSQYGPALVDRLREELPLDLERHWIVSI